MTQDISSILDLEKPEVELQNLDGKSFLELLDTMDMMRKAAHAATKLCYQQTVPELDEPGEERPVLDKPEKENK